MVYTDFVLTYASTWHKPEDRIYITILLLFVDCIHFHIPTDKIEIIDLGIYVC